MMGAIMTESNQTPETSVSAETFTPSEPSVAMFNEGDERSFLFRNAIFYGEKCAYIDDPESSDHGRIISYQWMTNPEGDAVNRQDYVETFIQNHAGTHRFIPHKSGGSLHYDELLDGKTGYTEHTRYFESPQNPTYRYGARINKETKDVVQGVLPEGELDYQDYIGKRAGVVAELVTKIAHFNINAYFDTQSAFRRVDPAYGNRNLDGMFLNAWCMALMTAASDPRNYTNYEESSFLFGQTELDILEFAENTYLNDVYQSGRIQDMFQGRGFYEWYRRDDGKIGFRRKNGLELHPEFNRRWVNEIVFSRPPHSDAYDLPDGDFSFLH